jgi:hypothetical protein
MTMTRRSAWLAIGKVKAARPAAKPTNALRLFITPPVLKLTRGKSLRCALLFNVPPGRRWISPAG